MISSCTLCTANSRTPSPTAYFKGFFEESRVLLMNGAALAVYRDHPVDAPEVRVLLKGAVVLLPCCPVALCAAGCAWLSVSLIHSPPLLPLPPSLLTQVFISNFDLMHKIWHMHVDEWDKEVWTNECD
jgi:hypothetical protein